MRLIIFSKAVIDHALNNLNKKRARRTLVSVETGRRESSLRI
jgi:hypothetical protein